MPESIWNSYCETSIIDATTTSQSCNYPIISFTGFFLQLILFSFLTYAFYKILK